MTQRAKLLLVDDDSGLVDVLSMALEDADFDVVTAADGRRGWEAFEREEPDLILLDLLMPELDGMHLCSMIRERSMTPIIMLTSRDQEMDKILGLETGADDYVTKPFSTRELIARIRSALRRAKATTKAEPEEVRAFGPLRLDRTQRQVWLHQSPIELTATEFDLLWTLTSRPEAVFDRNSLIDEVYGVDVVVADRTIDTFIKRIRRKLTDIDPDFRPIETVRRVGYRFSPPEPR